MYGLKVIEGANLNIITPETATIIACGTASMPNSLNGDGTYGLDIDLPGEVAIPTSKIGVILMPHSNIHFHNVCYYWMTWISPPLTIWFQPVKYLDVNSYNYYTKNESTGVMTAFTPGARTLNVASTWDPIISIFPVFGWDRVSANITAVRLWAATAYLIVDGLSVFKVVYSIGNTGGITQVDYAIFLKEWDY